MLLSRLKKFGQKFLNAEKQHPTFTIVVLNGYLVCSLLLALVILPGAYQSDPTGIDHVPLIYRILPLFNVIFLIALIRFRKWGFYGLLASVTFLFLTECYFHHYRSGFIHLLPFLLLYLVINVGGPKSTWRQLG